jgi:endo-alpha-1,4-polygalactosaminidase (GH114 family)
MRLFVRFLLCAAACVSLRPYVGAQDHDSDWTHFVRIGAYGLRGDNAEAIVSNAKATHVYGIEVDNDVPGRYESFLDPSAKLKAIRAVAQAAHAAKNYAFVYIAGTECITANADKSSHSVMKDHPDWVQRKITGEPAMFTSGAAFWISPGDEDVWISPYAAEWRKIYMQRVREIAATGIDGIYVDIPYWMTHFDGWEDTWASFDDATVAAFREKTGLDAKKDLKLGDFQDRNFRKWIDFRIDTMTDFIKEIRQNARAVNAQIVVIPEIYPGIEQEATRVGADVYEMYAVSDVIAHEYEFGNGDHMASSRSQMDWFLYQAGMLTFRAFAEGKATWILNYSWDGDKNVDAREAMKNLAMSQVMVNANFWDAPGHSMAGSNDEATRSEIFQWIEKNEGTLYSSRAPLHPVGVYFSPKSRDYDPNGFLPSYRGVLVMLLQAHREFQVVTPRTLEKFRGETLVLPNVTALSDSERQALRKFTSNGGRVVITGHDASLLAPSAKIARFENCPGKTYFEKLQSDFSAAAAGLPKDFLQALAVKTEMSFEAPPTAAANFALVDGTPHIFIANFSGLVPGKIAVPTPVTGATVSIPMAAGNLLAYLPFLGQTQILHGTKRGDAMQFELPSIERGAVVWVAGH